MLKVINATEGKNKFLQLLERCKEESYLITKNGEPTAVLLSADEYERIIETIKFYTYPKIKEQLKEWEK